MSFTWHGSSLLNKLFTLDHRYSHVFPQVFALLYLYHRIPTLFLVSFLWYKDDVRIVSKNPCGFSSNSRSDVQNAPNTTYFLASLGLLAPYLERACFLLATPAVSRVPRMMWYLVPGRSLTRPPRIKTTLCSCRL